MKEQRKLSSIRYLVRLVLAQRSRKRLKPGKRPTRRCVAGAAFGAQSQCLPIERSGVVVILFEELRYARHCDARRHRLRVRPQQEFEPCEVRSVDTSAPGVQPKWRRLLRLRMVEVPLCQERWSELGLVFENFFQHFHADAVRQSAGETRGVSAQ